MLNVKSQIPHIRLLSGAERTQYPVSNTCPGRNRPGSNIPSEILFPLAVQQIEIDLDDGVKVNYNKFGVALKKVPGLSEN